MIKSQAPDDAQSSSYHGNGSHRNGKNGNKMDLSRTHSSQTTPSPVKRQSPVKLQSPVKPIVPRGETRSDTRATSVPEVEIRTRSGRMVKPRDKYRDYVYKA